MPAPMAGLLSPLGRARTRAAAAPAGPAGTQLLWLRSTDLALADGDPVSAWPDQSGGGRDASASGSQRPVYHTNQINGLPAVGFDSVNQWLGLAAGGVVLDGAFTVYVVGHYAGPGTAWALGGTPSSQLLGVYTDGNFYSTDDSIFFPSVPFTGGARDLILRSGRPSLATAITVTASGFAATPLSSANVSMSTLTEIQAQNAGSIGGAGSMAEVLVYGRALSAGDRAQTDAYLTSRYALALP